MEAARAIEAAVGAWEGVVVAPHRSGGREFRYAGRELGHTHGDARVDLLFRRRVRDMLVETGRAEPHDVLPDSGWVTFRIGDGTDAAEAVELFRLAYERARVAERVRQARAPSG